VASEFEIFTNIGNGAKVVDPKNFDPELLFRYQGPVCTIPPNSFALGRSIEYFKIPAWVVGIVLGKSTYARCGIITNFTPLEASWEGHITIEISNTSPLPALIYANEGVAQALFFESDPANVPYGDRVGGGKYQGQTGITKARIEPVYKGGKIA
jgi:dCTP deaminase